MKCFEEIKSILKKHKQELKERFGVIKIGIFGSHAKGNATEESDIDIYVEFDLDSLTFAKYLELIEYLENLLGAKVDIITKGGIESIRIPYIKEDIKRNIVYA